MKQIHRRKEKKQKQRVLQKRIPDQGFSLVELIVVMAIVSIVGLAIVSFLSFCLNQYRRAHSEVSLQTKVQIVQNQIDNFMVNTNRAVYWDDTDKKLWMIGEEESGGTYFAQCIEYRSSDGQMYFEKYDCTKPNEKKEEYEVSNAKGEQPLVDGVEEFTVTIPTKMKQNGKMTVKLKVHNGAGTNQKTYESTFDVMSRNPVKDAKSVTIK